MTRNHHHNKLKYMKQIQHVEKQKAFSAHSNPQEP